MEGMSVMKKIYRQLLSLRVYALFSVVFVVMAGLLLSNSFPVYAEPLEDTAGPVLTVNNESADQRNVATFTLGIADDHRKSASIEILSSDEHSLSPRTIAQDESGAPSLSLRWDTRTVEDGVYRVIYTATDLLGQKSEERYSFNIENAQPLVTLSESSDGRTIGGSISRSDVTFRVSSDGVPIAASPTIDDTPDPNGNFIWSLLLPTSVLDGTHSIGVVALVNGTQRESAVAANSLIISTPLKVVEQTATMPVPTVISIADRVQEIGQFIAPSLPTVPQTQLYGVSTTDITAHTPSSQHILSAPQKAATAAYSGDVRAPTFVDSTAPIAATESGWLIFGAAWYWWLLSGALLGCALFVSARAVYERQTRTVFVGAKSL